MESFLQWQKRQRVTGNKTIDAPKTFLEVELSSQGICEIFSEQNVAIKHNNAPKVQSFEMNSLNSAFLTLKGCYCVQLFACIQMGHFDELTARLSSHLRPHSGSVLVLYCVSFWTSSLSHVKHWFVHSNETPTVMITFPVCHTDPLLVLPVLTVLG